MFAGTIQRFNATTGAVDPSFGLSGLAFPQTLLANPNGSGFLAGILGFTNGSGNISKFGYDGSSLGVFANELVHLAYANGVFGAVGWPQPIGPGRMTCLELADVPEFSHSSTGSGVCGAEVP